MPIHDWTKVNAGTFHDFHQTWIIEIKRALNSGVLPAGFYAMAEQVAGGWGPEVLTLEAPENEGEREAMGDGLLSSAGATAVAERPPAVAFHARAEIDIYSSKANSLVIRHSSDDRVIAVIEIVSPGNKSSGHALGKISSHKRGSTGKSSVSRATFQTRESHRRPTTTMLPRSQPTEIMSAPLSETRFLIICSRTAYLWSTGSKILMRMGELP